MNHSRQYFQATLLSLMSFYCASTYSATSVLTVENSQWNQISIPADVTGQSITTLFSDDIDISKYPDTWIIWRFDASNNRYRVVDQNEPMESTDGYWFIQDTGAQIVLTLPQDLPNEKGEYGPGCAIGERCITIALATRSQDITWTMLGSGINEPVITDNIVFVSERKNECYSGCGVDEASRLNLSASALFRYNPATTAYDDSTDFWIKTGIDSPENFFGYAGFDNAPNQSGGAGTNGLIDGLHRYGLHIDDWTTGDPLFRSSDSGVDSKGIIGAVNYLSSQEINSIYFLPMNLGGDGRDTYPFLDASGSEHDNTHYDVSKLFQWNTALHHMQSKGISAHIVLAETEEGNTNWFDDAQLGVERKFYYRELVSRFAYLNGVKWNLSEESHYGTDRHIEFASYLRTLDWANHPIAVHTNLDSPGRTYDSQLGVPVFDTASIQFSPRFANLYVELWREATSNAGRKWVVDMDEVAPAGTGLTDANADSLRQNVLYPTLFSGGNIEWYFGYHNLPLGGDLRTENFRTTESMFTYMRYARRFMEQSLPYWTMSPNDDAIVGGRTGDQVFESAGEVYALYLLNGSAGLTLNAPEGNYDLLGFNPRLGEFVGGTNSVFGGQIALGASPNESSDDWVALLERK